ncbi:MAG: serine/threonine protein kinase [Actinomycetia bacterium]|nr:serine/threonine protein kinase [Actinomycetes bacterium]
MLELGSLVAGYRLERVLGTGGMGTVYLAKHPTLPRRDALKVLGAELAQDVGFRERFVHEAEIASLLDHPNIVAIYGRAEIDDEQLWIALQYVEGIDAEMALRAGRMPPQRAIHIVGEVAKALDHAHKCNVVHHDVKPANLLLSGEPGHEERVRLSDFGVARPIGDVDGPDDDGGYITATLAYTAPEALSGKPVDGRADLYSLGCTLFRLLTGRQPFFDAGGTAETIKAHLEQPPPRVSDHLSWATAEIDQVIARALAKDPEQRHGSVREFAAAAAEAVRGAGPPTGVPEWHRERVVGAADEGAEVELAESSPSPRPPTDPPRLPAEPSPPPVGAPRPPIKSPHQAPAPPVRPAAATSRPVKAVATETEPPRAAAASVPAAPAGREGEEDAGPQFGALPEFKQTFKPRRRVSKPVMLAGAAAAVAVLIVALVIMLGGSPESSSPPQAVPPPPPTAAAIDNAGQHRLAGMLPAGYPSGVCRPAGVSAGAIAAMSCGPNIDAAGPTSATYTLFGDIGALHDAFNDVTGESTTVVCPGNMQSPGAWRRRATPDVAAGTLYCGERGDSAVLAWTTDDDLLLNVVRAGRQELGGLYQWWSSHS